MSDVIELKCDPSPFKMMVHGVKRFEYRRDDRGVHIGDLLCLREWTHDEGYSGWEITATVTYKLTGPDFGVPVGFCVLSLSGITARNIPRGFSFKVRE